MYHPYYLWTDNPTPPTPPPSPPNYNGLGGGGGGYLYRHKVKARGPALNEQVRDWVDRVYSELTAKDVPESVRKEAAAIVKPLSSSKAKVPKASTVDWEALSMQAQRVDQLIALYQKRIDDDIDDEDAVILGMFL